MNGRNASGIESRLETAVSYLLITGVVVSLLLEIAGVCLYLRECGSLAISQESSAYIQGQNFFSFLYSFWNDYAGNTAVLLMIAGVVILLLTPFTRIILSAVYFGWAKNWKYVFITLFVLVVISLSLVFH
ncbi:MAG: DUF1634 domain-containing protein [Dehalococcoidales bacterium]|nr:DUF1634 domain-containing protein [Dehalococcoidales bacterium]